MGTTGPAAHHCRDASLMPHREDEATRKINEAIRGYLASLDAAAGRARDGPVGLRPYAALSRGRCLMTGKLEIYKCPLCDTVVEVLEQCGVELICCGREMELLTEQSHAADNRDHTPIVERTDLGIRVSIGAHPHAMGQCHYIKWVEVLAEDGAIASSCIPARRPKQSFRSTSAIAAHRGLSVRYYCSLHGLFKSDCPPILPARQDMAQLRRQTRRLTATSAASPSCGCGRCPGCSCS